MSEASCERNCRRGNSVIQHGELTMPLKRVGTYRTNKRTFHAPLPTARLRRRPPLARGAGRDPSAHSCVPQRLAARRRAARRSLDMPRRMGEGSASRISSDGHVFMNTSYEGGMRYGKRSSNAGHRLIHHTQTGRERSRNIIRSQQVHDPIIAPVCVYLHESYAETYSRFRGSR